MISQKEEDIKEEYGVTGKRLNYISWHQHHMYLAKMNAERCADKENKSGCQIIDEENYPVASGYYGGPNNTKTLCEHSRHAEAIALHGKSTCAKNCTLYTTKFPNCIQCVKLILQKGISKIYHLEEIPREIQEQLEQNGVQCEKYQITRQLIIQVP